MSSMSRLGLSSGRHWSSCLAVPRMTKLQRLSFASSSTPTPPASATTGGALGFFKKAKETAVQLFSGLRQLYRNVLLTTELQRRLDSGFALSRAQETLRHRTAQDMKRAAPFFLIVLILPEVIPLLIVRGWDIIPSTCYTPAQLQTKWGRLKKLRAETPIEPSEWASMLEPRQEMLEWSKNHPQVLAPSALSSTQLKFLNQRLGIWAWGFSGQLRQRLMQHLEYLELDDGYLRDSEILKSLSEEDLRWALEDRGICSIDRTEGDMRVLLQQWIQMREDGVAPTLGLYHSIHWSQQGL